MPNPPVLVAGSTSFEVRAQAMRSSAITVSSSDGGVEPRKRATASTRASPQKGYRGLNHRGTQL